MPLDIHALCRQITPQKTILVFGAGSSIRSGAPSASELVNELLSKFKLDPDPTLTLSDLATIIEQRFDRRSLIAFLRERLTKLRPTGGILNLPLFDWAGIYTTNYDTIIEQAFRRCDMPLAACSSNFDFDVPGEASAQRLYKLHGTVEKDISDGHNSRIVISRSDYDYADKYRELLLTKFEEQLGSHSVVIIGYSLSDPDLRAVIEEALRRKKKAGAPGKIFLFIFDKNENQALIFEHRGFEVCFGGLDEFFSELTKAGPAKQLVLSVTNEPLDVAPAIYPATIDVATSKAQTSPHLDRMFNGRPASFADIDRGWTFPRAISGRLEGQLTDSSKRIAFILGAAGVGKTTAARQVLHGMCCRGVRCYEHKADLALPVSSWISVDRELRKRKESAVLLIDDAHDHLRDVNKLVEAVCSHEVPALRLLLTSSLPHWNPRLKSPVIFSHGTKYTLSTLSDGEINSLLDLLEDKPEVSALVEAQFLGFARNERQRRLIERCSADMFVCLKNIFGFQSIDNIILQEYASLSEDYQEIYRQIAAMQASGVRIHRQLIIRAVGIDASNISRTLADLDGIVEEYTVNPREGVYGWSLRHPLIAEIISKYKFSSQQEFYSMLDRIIDCLNPAYPIEIKSIGDMCGRAAGISRIYDKRSQNVLLRKMISLAPFLNVPRHRLITNLIDLDEFEAAETEIRIFSKELRIDGPVHRYKVKLLLERARKTPGIMDVDRASIALDAATLADVGVGKFSDDKNMYTAFMEAGAVYYKYSGRTDVFDNALAKANVAQRKILDPDLQRAISRFELLGSKFQSVES